MRFGDEIDDGVDDEVCVMVIPNHDKRLDWVAGA